MPCMATRAAAPSATGQLRALCLQAHRPNIHVSCHAAASANDHRAPEALTPVLVLLLLLLLPLLMLLLMWLLLLPLLLLLLLALPTLFESGRRIPRAACISPPRLTATAKMDAQARLCKYILYYSIFYIYMCNYIATPKTGVGARANGPRPLHALRRGRSLPTAPELLMRR